MRIAVIGNSGSGKSTLAKRLAAAGNAALLDLDTVAWEPGKIAVPRPLADALADVDRFCRTHDAWVVEGCYAALVGKALAYAPRLVFLDPGVERCLAHCRARPFEPHKYASKEEQDARLDFLLEWVRGYDTREGDLGRAAHEALFAAYGGEKERLEDVERFVTRLARRPG